MVKVRGSASTQTWVKTPPCLLLAVWSSSNRVTSLCLRLVTCKHPKITVLTSWACGDAQKSFSQASSTVPGAGGPSGPR